MSFRKEIQPKDGFLDKGPQFFRERFKRTENEDLKKRLATDADPYAQVPSGKERRQKRERNYAIDPNSIDELSDDDFPRARTHQVSNRGSLAEAYSVLSESGSVRFGAQREDGSWEASPVEAKSAPKSQGSAFGAAAVKQQKHEISTAEFASGLLFPVAGLSVDPE